MIEIKIRNRNNAGEFPVQLFVDGIHQDDADYFTDDRRDAALTGCDMLKRAEENERLDHMSGYYDAERMQYGAVDLPKREALVELESRIVTGNGWIAELKDGQQRRQFTATLQHDNCPIEVKGSPLGRGWSERQAKADLIRRVIDESEIRLELHQTRPTKTN